MIPVRGPDYHLVRVEADARPVFLATIGVGDEDRAGRGAGHPAPRSIVTVEQFDAVGDAGLRQALLFVRGSSSRSRPTMRLRRSPARVERGRAGRGQDRPMALGRSLLQDARGGDGRRARRSRPSQRRACEARERRQAGDTVAGDTRRHASRGRDPRACGQTRAGHRRTVAVRGDVGLDHSQAAAFCRAASRPPAGSGSRRPPDKAGSSATGCAPARRAAPVPEARASCSSGRAPGRRRSPPAARARPRRRRPRRCQARASGRRRRARGARTRREASRRRAPQHR